MLFCSALFVSYPEAGLKPRWYIMPECSSQNFFCIDSDQFMHRMFRGRPGIANTDFNSLFFSNSFFFHTAPTLVRRRMESATLLQCGNGGRQGFVQSLCSSDTSWERWGCPHYCRAEVQILFMMFAWSRVDIIKKIFFPASFTGISRILQHPQLGYTGGKTNKWTNKTGIHSV